MYRSTSSKRNTTLIKSSHLRNVIIHSVRFIVIYSELIYGQKGHIKNEQEQNTHTQSKDVICAIHP